MESYILPTFPAFSLNQALRRALGCTLDELVTENVVK